MYCDERDNLAAFLDGELSDADNRRISAHVESCAGCRAQLDLLRRSYAALEHLQEVDAPEGLATKVRSRARRQTLSAYGVGALAAAAAILVVFSFRFVVPAFVDTKPPLSEAGIDDAVVIAALEDDAVFEELDLLEDFDLVENADVLEDVDVFVALEELEEAQLLGLEAYI